MKPPIEIQTPSNDDKTEFENFYELASKLLKVPKKELDAKLLAEKKQKNKQSKALKEVVK
jgi:6-pyruvoyl-tetrahydropterin synthase